MSDKKTVVQQIAELENQVTALTTERDGLTKTNGELTGQLKSANDSAAKANNELAEANRLLAECRVSLGKAEGEAKASKTSLDELKQDFDAKVLKAASAEASKIVAGQTHQPVNSEVNDKQTKVDPKKAALTGMARFAAVAEEQVRPQFEAATGLKTQ